MISFNDIIFTLEELNELFLVVKPLTSVIHLNIRSLNQHFTELCNLTDSTPFVLDFIGCSETWLSPYANLDDYILSGYVLVTDNCASLCGGGVGLSIKTEYIFHIRDDLSLNVIENLWVETQDLITVKPEFCDPYVLRPPAINNHFFWHG